AADDRHPHRVGRPDGKAHAMHAVDGREIGTERLGELEMPALADEVEIDLTEQRPEGIGILGDLPPARPEDVEQVMPRLDVTYEKAPRLRRPERNRARLPRIGDLDSFRARHVDPEVAPAWPLVGSEQR